MAVHLGLFARDGLGPDQLLRDTDSYMWMNRVVHLAETGAWFDHTYPRVNPPVGHEQHWTRPLDALLLGGGAVIGSVVGFERGLYLWGVAITPLLHLLALLTLVWAVQPLIRRGLLPAERVPLLLLVFVAQPGIYQPFIMGRPDHHAPLALLFVAYLGCWLHVLLDRRRAIRSAVIMGIVAALAIWVNVEALIYVVLGMGGMGMSWLLGNRAIARLAAIHAGVLLAGLFGALVAEWGPAALSIREMDTLSVPHLGLFGLATLFWGGLWWATAAAALQGGAARAALAAPGIGVVLVAVYASFPEFFGSPLAGVDVLYHETRLSRISELQPLMPPLGTVLEKAGMLILYASIALIALPYMTIRMLRDTDPDERITWLLFLMAAAFYLFMAIGQRRWVDYLALSSVIPFGLFAAGVVGRLSARVRPPAIAVVRPPLILSLVFGHFILGVMLLGGGGGETVPAGPDANDRWAEQPLQAGLTPAASHAAGRTCDLVQISQLVSDLEDFPETLLILAHTDHGPELLYRTHHSVLSIPNHRHQPGYTFMRQVLAEPDARQAAAALHDREVDLLVLCMSDITTGFFRFPVERSFVNYLAEGGIPEGFDLHASTRYWRVYRRQPPL
jgi:hypothetical protein